MSIDGAAAAAAASDLPADASVIVVGAGLSGLTTARELVRAGVDDVVVLDARDRVGGRLCELVRPNGRVLMKGGEWTGAAQQQLHALAAELGVGVEPLPPFADEERMGRFVRVHDGRRYVEDVPLSGDPAAQRAFAAAVAALDELAATVPTDAPWTAAHAAALDRRSIGHWLDENVAEPAARAAMEGELGSFGDPYETSLFYLLWLLACFGGWEAHGAVYTSRFVGGSAQIPRLLAERLGPRVQLSAPVRTVRRADEAVVVETDRGRVRGRALVLAMEPGQAGKIEFDPVLPADRDRLQARWQAGHGAKLFAVYDEPWWRAEGLAGVAFGPPPIPLVQDLSPNEADEGILCALFFAGSAVVARHAAQLADERRTRAMVLDALEAYFGPRAREPRELHVCSWDGDRWSDGCGSQLPMGTLSTVGQALRRPIGRIVFAGAETGAMDFMEGAVTAGQRAAREAAALVGRAPVA